MATTNKGTTASETFGTTSPVTGSAPTAVDLSDGQPFQDLNAVTVVAVAPSGQTFSGAGTLQCYLLDAEVGVWARYPGGDLAVPSGSRAVAFEPFEMIGPRAAYGKWVPNGVTFSGGSTGVAVYQLGYSNIARGSYRAA